MQIVSTNAVTTRQLAVLKPEHSYFGSLAANVNPLSLLGPIFDRFPFQPPFPGHHPALHTDYAIIKGIRGARFFMSMSKRNEEAFYRINRERALQRNIKERLARHDSNEERHQSDFVEGQVLAERLRALARFRYHADHALLARRVFLELLTKSYYRSLEARHTRFDIGLERMLHAHDLFWQDVKKNLQKEPRSANIATTSLQSLLSTLPYQTNKSRIIQAIRRVKRNLESMHAEQIAGRQQLGGGVSTEIYAMMIRRFHRPSYLRAQHRSEQDEREDGLLAARLAITDLRSRDGAAKREGIRLDAADRAGVRLDFIAASEQRADRYWQQVDAEHRKLLLPLPLSSTNRATVFALFASKDPAPVLWALDRVKTNQLHAHAEQVTSHADGMVAGIPFNLHTRFRQLRAKRKTFVDQIASELDKQRTATIDRRLQHYADVSALSKNKLQQQADARATYWDLYDHKHHEPPRALVLTGPNTAENSHKLTEDASTRVHTAMAMSKKRNGMRPHDPITATAIANTRAYHADIAEVRAEHPLLRLLPREPLQFKLAATEGRTSIFSPSFRPRRQFTFAPQDVTAVSPPPQGQPHTVSHAKNRGHVAYHAQVQHEALTYDSLHAANEKATKSHHALEPATNEAAQKQLEVRRVFKSQARVVGGVRQEVDPSELGTEYDRLPHKPQKKVVDKP